MDEKERIGREGGSEECVLRSTSVPHPVLGRLHGHGASLSHFGQICRGMKGGGLVMVLG